MSSSGDAGYYLMCQNLKAGTPPEVIYTATNKVDLYEHFSDQYYADVKQYCPGTYPEPCEYIAPMAAGYAVRTPDIEKFIYPQEPSKKG